MYLSIIRLTTKQALTNLRFCSPVQFNPSPSSRYPPSQLQKKLPMVLVHLCSHPPFAVSHSSMSMEQENTQLHTMSRPAVDLTTGLLKWFTEMTARTYRRLKLGFLYYDYAKSSTIHTQCSKNLIGMCAMNTITIRILLEPILPCSKIM